MAFLHHDGGIILQSLNKTLLDPHLTGDAPGEADAVKRCFGALQRGMLLW